MYLSGHDLNQSSWSTHHIRRNGKAYNLIIKTDMNLLLSSFSSKVSTNNDTTSRRRAQNSRKLPHGDEDWRWSAEVSTNFQATRWVWPFFSASQPSKEIWVWRWRRHVHFDCLQRPVKRSECQPDWCVQFQWIRSEGIANHTQTV